MPTDIAIDAAAQPQGAVQAHEDTLSLAWTCGVIVVITALLALFSAQSMKSWAETLPPSPTNLIVRQAAENWFDVTDNLGLAAPRAGLRSVWTSLHQPTFPGPAQPDGNAAPQR
jgi:hypothetical protein